jgi:hypothetical protein
MGSPLSHDIFSSFSIKLRRMIVEWMEPSTHNITKQMKNFFNNRFVISFYASRLEWNFYFVFFLSPFSTQSILDSHLIIRTQYKKNFNKLFYHSREKVLPENLWDEILNCLMFNFSLQFFFSTQLCCEKNVNMSKEWSFLFWVESLKKCRILFYFLTQLRKVVIISLNNININFHDSCKFVKSFDGALSKEWKLT